MSTMAVTTKQEQCDARGLLLRVLLRQRGSGCLKSKFLSFVCMAVACASAEQPQPVSPILTAKDLPPGIILIEGKAQGVRLSPGSNRIFQDESISSADYKNQFASGGHLCAKDGRTVIGNDIRISFNLAPKTQYDLRNSQEDCAKGRRGKEVGSLEGDGIVFCKIYDNSNDKDKRSFYAILIGGEKVLEASMSGDNEVYINFWRVESKNNPDFDKRNVINTTVPTVDMMKAILRNLVPKVSSGVKLKFIASQVLDSEYCGIWIKDKPAVLRAKLEWDDPGVDSVEVNVEFFQDGKKLAPTNGKHLLPADGKFTFQYTYGGQAGIFLASAESANLIFAPNKTGRVKLEAVVTPVTIRGKAAAKWSKTPVRANVDVNVIAMDRNLKIHFVPIAVGEWSGLNKMDDKEFRNVRDSNMEFLRGVLPLPPQNVNDTGGSSVMLKPDTSGSTGEKVTGVTKMSLLARLQTLHQTGQVDYAVGIVPQKWLIDEGITELRHPNALLIGYPNQFSTALAHEIGHLLGLEHGKLGKYVLDAKGAWVKSATEFSRRDVRWRVRENEPFIELMNADIDTAEATWIDKLNYTRLLSALR